MAAVKERRGATVVCAPHAPFSTRGVRRRRFAAGKTVGSVLLRVQPPDWPKGVAQIVCRNGEVDVPLDTPMADGDLISVAPRYGVEVLIAIGMFILQMIVYAAISYALNLILGKVFGPDQKEAKLDESVGKPTYSWNGPRTVYSQGAACAIGYGKMQTGGQVLSYYVTNDGNRSYLNMLLAVSEGEIRSIGGSTEELDEATGSQIPDRIWVNGVKLREYEHVKVWTRFGKLQQTAIPGMNDLRIQYPVNQRLRVRGEEQSVSYTTHRECSRARLRLVWPQGLYVVAGSEGTVYSSLVQFKYRFRSILNGSPSGEWTSWFGFQYREKSTNPIYRDYEIGFPSSGQWEVELYRDSETTPGAENVISYQDRVEWDSTLEIQDRDIRYIRTALVGIKALATEGLQGARPEFRIEFEGRILRVWNGSEYVDQYSANPWWVILDLLRNTHYGLGHYLRNIVIDPDDFKEAADEADELVFSGLKTLVAQDSVAGTNVLMVDDTTGFTVGDTIYIGKTTARQEQASVLAIEPDRLILSENLTYTHTRAQADVVGKFHERYRFDGILDEATSAWEAIQVVAKAARGVVIKLGNRIMLKRAVAQEPGWLITEGNCRRVRLQYVNRYTQANEWRGQFLRSEENALYQPDTLVVQSERAQLDSVSAENFYSREGRRTEDIRLVGVNRIEQVRRDLGFRQRVIDNSNKILTLEVPLELIGTAPGSVFAFAHRTIGVTNNGRILGAAVSGGDTITLDRDVTIGAGTWAIRVRTDADQTITRTIASAAGSYARGDTIQISGTWPADIQAKAPYALGVQGSEVQEYEITKWRLLKDLYVEIEAVNYDAANYQDPDAIAA